MYAQAPVLVSPPAETPVSLAEAKAHLRVDGNDEDALITGAIAAAVAHLDGWSGILGRALVAQTWRQDLDGFPRDRIALPLAPVQSVTSVVYRDTDGQSVTLDPASYVLTTRAGGPAIERVGDAWPPTALRPDAVRVTFVAGYGDVPTLFDQPILLTAPDGTVFVNEDGQVLTRGTEEVGTTVAGQVPPAIKAAILLMVGDLYAHRETALSGNVAAVSVPMSMTVDRLLAPYRRIGV